VAVDLGARSRLRRLAWASLLAGCSALPGCAQTSWESTGPDATPALATADQTMGLEQADRINRFGRLARMSAITPPQIDQLTVPAERLPGARHPVPVIRVVFEERALFDAGSALPRPEADAIIAVIAENMRRDVPDVCVTVLGHTDAVGPDDSNIDLSRRRALHVLQRLVDHGVNPGQLGTVAVGKAQPIAPNDTAAGRARNRRVEFLISPSEEANLSIVQMRAVNPAFLRLGSVVPGARPVARPVVPRSAVFLKPAYSGPSDLSEAPLDRPRITLAEVRPVRIDVTESEPAETGSPVPRDPGN